MLTVPRSRRVSLRYLTADGNILTPLLMGATLLFAKTPLQGAATSIYLASSADVEGVTGKYYSDCKPQAAKSTVYDADLRKRLWDLSCEMAQVDFDVPAMATSPVQPPMVPAA
jgi:hypothetical protein